MAGERVSLRDRWYIAALASDLAAGPVARRILGEPIVVFRSGGESAALEDRCAHRNMALSAGQVVGGAIQCPYHGWRYGPTGACVEIPSLGEGRPVPPGCQVRRYPTTLSDGYVWVWMGHGQPALQPYRYPNLGSPGWTSFRMYNRFQAPVEACAENFLDVPHAVFVHVGLFRNPDPRERVARVERSADRVVAAFEYDPEPTSLISRLAFPRGATMLHTDAFILPSTTQVDYAFTADRHFTISSQCTPVTDAQTDVYTVLTFRFGSIGPLFRLVLEPLSWRIIRQDVDILARQTEQIRLFGGAPRFTYAETDLLARHIKELRACADRGEAAAPCEEQVPIRF